MQRVLLMVYFIPCKDADELIEHIISEQIIKVYGNPTSVTQLHWKWQW